MIKQKELYSSPTTELLVVRFEEAFLQFSTEGSTINAATVDEWNDEL